MSNTPKVTARGYAPTKLVDWLRAHFKPTITAQITDISSITQELTLNVDLQPFDDDGMWILNAMLSSDMLRLGPVDPTQYEQGRIDSTGVDEYVVPVGELLNHACDFIRNRSLMRSSSHTDVLSEASAEVTQAMKVPEYRSNVPKTLADCNKRFRIRMDKLIRAEGGLENFANTYVDDLRRKAAAAAEKGDTDDGRPAD